MANAEICTVYLWVDEDGSFVAHHDEDEARDLQSDNLAGARRLVVVNVRVPLPKPSELTVDAEEEDLAPATAV